MKRYIILSFLLLILASCKKKEYTCGHEIQYFAPSVSFVGFTEMEIKNISISRYKANTGFTDLISIDTLSDVNPVFSSDTAYAKIENYYTSGFLQIGVGIDYKIKLITTGQEYIITDVASGPTSESWTQEDYCAPGASQIAFSTFSYKLNNVEQWPVSLTTNHFFIFLKR